MENRTAIIDGVRVRISSDYAGARLSGHLSQAKLFVQPRNGHFAIGRSCTICGHGVTKRKEKYPGRGWGMREGNILRGQMIQHIKVAHAELLGKPMD